MYTVYAGDTIVYHPNMVDQGYDIYNTSLTIQDNKPESFKFTLPVDNVAYNSIVKMKTPIYIYEDGVEIFRGRVLDEDRDFNNNKVVTCEGELAYLYDSIVRPYTANNQTVSAFFSAIVSQHNSQVDADKQFTVGTVDVSPSETLAFTLNDYSTTWQVINNYLLEPYGGHIRARLDNGVRYLDYIESYNSVSDQVIHFGENLLDISQYTTAEKMMTRLIPLGATFTEEKDDSEIISGTELRTAESEDIKAKNKSDSTHVYMIETKVYILAKSKANKQSQIKVDLGLRIKSGGPVTWSGTLDPYKYFYGRICINSKQKAKTAIDNITLDNSDSYTNICTWTGWVKNDTITIKGELVNNRWAKDEKPVTTAVGISFDFYSYAQKTVYTDISSVTENNVDYLVDETADNLYGPIIKVNHWSDIADPAILMTKGLEYLQKNALLSINLELNAIDLSLLSADYSKIKMGDSVRVISAPHGIDEFFTCDKMVIDLQDPESNTYTLGKDITSLTDKTVAGYSQSIVISDALQEVVNNLTETDNIVEQINNAVNDIYNNYANIETVVENLSAEYMEVDFANIQTASIDNLFANTAVVDKIDARYATIANLQANYLQADVANLTSATIANLIAGTATVDGLNAYLATIDMANITNATISNLIAGTATVDGLNAYLATIDLANIDTAHISQAFTNYLSANYADITLANIDTAHISQVFTNYLDANYADITLANIDTANISSAFIQAIYSNKLVTDFSVTQEGYVTGFLEAVRIDGDLITAGTIKADKLIVQGSDGLYYQLNVQGNGDLTPEQLSVPATI